MKKLLFAPWHLMRFIRLFFGLFLLFQAFETGQWFFLGFAAFFLFQALMNLGCGAQGCALPAPPKSSDE
jgi:hypothetical protein